MKIVALHTDFRLYWPARLHALSEKLKSLGHDFFVIEIAGKGSNYAFANTETEKKTDWICLFPDEEIENLNLALAKNKAKEMLDLINPDVVMAGSFAFPSGAAAIDWAKANNKAVIIFDDSKKEDVPRNFVVNVVKRMFYTFTDAIFCPSDEWLDTFKYWGFKDNAIFYGVDVVDNAFWAEKDDSELSFQLPRKYLLCVGRQVSRKNFHTVIKAFDLFLSKNEFSDLELLLVGEGEEREHLENMITDTLKSKVHFLPFLDPVSLRTVYHRALVFLLPSYSEQWGLVVNEAMASGLPVIVSKQSGCCRTLINPHSNGLIFDAYNPIELASVTEQVLFMDNSAIQEMGKESLKIISSWDLDRFSSGAIDAINYAAINKRKKWSYFFLRYFLKKWHGKYNIG